MHLDLIDALRRADIFWGLERADIEILADVLPRLDLQAGQELFSQGSLGDSMYVVTQGRLQVRVSDGRGVTTTVGLLGPGESVGEMACIDPCPRSAGVVASVPTVVVEISTETIATLEEVAPAIAAAVVAGIMRHVTARLRQTDERLELELRTLHRDRDPARQAGAQASGETRPGGPAPFRGFYAWRGAPVPEGLQPGDLETLASAGRLLVWEEGQLLCAEGRAGASCFVVLEGQVEVFKASAGGGRHLAALGPGSLLGQMALVDSAPRSASIRAQTRVVALEIGRDMFERLVRSANPFALRFQRQIALAGIRQLRLANARLAGLLGRGEQREEPAEAAEPKLTRVQTALYEWDVSVED
ncbi:MAG: cyclic nucleotide-binding domain-containing protein [Pseudomonadota bacterium]